MVNPFKSPTILSFCPGGLLGIERGVEQAIGKLNILAYVEIETFIIANLFAGMEEGLLDPAIVWTDATTFDARTFYGKIHGIIGGYPCPGESLAGLREGHLYKGFIWPSIRRAIAASRPLWCFFENVDDHLSGTFPIIQRSLRLMGYAVEAGVYTAEEVGAPHERKRLFIFAMAEPCRLAARGRYRELLKPGKADEREAWLKNGQWGRDGISISSEKLADPQNGKNERGESGSMAKKKGKRGCINPTVSNGSQALDTGSDKSIYKTTKSESAIRAISDRGADVRGEKEIILGQELAHPDSTGFTEQRDDAKQAESGNDRVGDADNKLGHADSIGQERYGSELGVIGKTQAEDQWSETDRTNSPFGKYPAGQGPFQYPWEEPRLAESKVGFTVNGYNFREDFLRALGNGVVADSAEIAFIDLLTKHLQ